MDKKKDQFFVKQITVCAEEALLFLSITEGIYINNSTSASSQR